MKHEEALAWIDGANAYELRDPPQELKAVLGHDSEAKRYYELSVMLTGTKQKADLLHRFRRAIAGRESPVRRSTHTRRLCFGLGAAAFLAASVLLVTLWDGRGRDTRENKAVYASSLELTYGIAKNFGITDNSRTDGESTDGLTDFAVEALDYCYAVSLF